MLTALKPKVEPTLRKIIKPISFIHPNLLTVLGLIPPLIFFYALGQGSYPLALFMLLAGVFDTLDGTIARMTGKVSEFGGLLDSTLDRLSDLLYICAFGSAGLISWYVVIFFLGGAYLTSYIRSRAELAAAGKITLKVGIMERSKRILLLILVVSILIFTPQLQISYLKIYELVFIVGGILGWITVLQRLTKAYQLLD